MKMTISLILVMVLACCLLGEVFAEQRINIPVSCTIPAIPGLNVPLNDKASAIKPEAKIEREKKEDIKNNSNQNTKIQEDRLVKNDTQRGVMLQTVYNR